jgi:hypothetical protein
MFRRHHATRQASRALPTGKRGDSIMRSGCLWLLGVPLPIIIILWLITGHA